MINLNSHPAELPSTCTEFMESSSPEAGNHKTHKSPPWPWYVDFLKHQRPVKHSKNHDRLAQALTIFGNEALIGQTLLDKKIRKKNAANLYNRLIRHLKKSLLSKKPDKRKLDKFGRSAAGYFECKQDQDARKLIGMVTIVHSVTALDVEAALAEAKKLWKQVIELFRSVLGSACIGAIEIEITSIKQMRRVQEFFHSTARNSFLIDEDGVLVDDVNTSKGIHSKKLASLGILGDHLSESEIGGECGQFLIHFHGVYRVKNKSDVQLLKQAARRNPNWCRSKAQVQFSPLSKTWDKKPKSIEENIKHIARYITKGGVEDGLQYSIKFKSEMPMTYEEYCNFSDHNTDPERQVKIEEGKLLDFPNLSNYEINQLTLVIDGMMNWNKSRTGYVISVGKWH